MFHHDLLAAGGDLHGLVGRLSYWHPLDDDDRAAVLALPHKVRTAEPHQFLVREFDKTRHSCVLLDGFAIRHKFVGDGRRQIVAIHMKGEFVDLQNSLLGLADHSVQMLTRGRFAVIRRGVVKALARERPNVAQALWIDTLVDGSVFREWIANVGRRDARTRLAHLLCEFSLRLKVAKLGALDNYELPMTQEQLADATGLTPVHVNRTIKQLESEGLIDRSSPRSIRIGDWHKLAETGDFNSSYLHLHAHEPALEPVH